MLDNDLEVYIYRGNEGETVPTSVERLIVDEGIPVLPDRLCFSCKRLQEVSLPNGLIKIGNQAFSYCENLSEIRIGGAVQLIGKSAFSECYGLTKVEFESTSASSSHHMLQKIDEMAFFLCESLQRITLPSSLTFVDYGAFDGCHALIEANLSTTGVREIPDLAFSSCILMQSVSLPNTLEQICRDAFRSCKELVAVILPLDSQSIRLGKRCFEDCIQLANIVLPRDSTAAADSFCRCDLLQERYSVVSGCILAGLIDRFEGFSIHRMCYDHSPITVEDLRQRIAHHHEEGRSLVDEFGMSPFHVFFLRTEPSIGLLDVLLESLPNQILKRKDANRRRPLDYLINNWTDATKSLLHTTLQKSMIDSLAHWGATIWMKVMQNMVQDILDEDDKDQRTRLCNEVYALLEHYENVEATSILEMALWKTKLESELANDGTKRQAALDREECRFLNGSDVVIPQVTMFLNIPRSSSQDI